MSFNPIGALLAYHAAIDAHDIDAVGCMLATDASYSSGGLGDVKGCHKIVEAMRKYFAKHPDHQSWDDEVKQTGELSARSVWKLQATNKLTGEVVLRVGTEDIEFDATGKILRVTVKDET